MRILSSVLLSVGLGSGSLAADVQVIERGGVTLVVAVLKDEVQLHRLQWFCAKDVGGKLTVAALAPIPSWTAGMINAEVAPCPP